MMEIVLSVNRSWIDDAYFSLFILGEESGGNVRIPQLTATTFCHCP